MEKRIDKGVDRGMQKKWSQLIENGLVTIKNENGATLRFSTESGIGIIEADGYAFKDLNRNGKLQPYKDWRLPISERIEDLANQLTISEIAGLMLYSGHQAVTSSKNSFASMFAGTYDGLALEDSTAVVSDLTDQQKEFLTKDHLRHILVTVVESPEISATWSNNLQAFVEGIGHGIPVNISSDPRHGADANSEYNAGAGGDISKWPEALGLAATFEPELVRDFGHIAGREYRALGIATALSPQVDLATEPRWMRFSGTFGEGVKLVTDLSEAYCSGFQTSEKASEIHSGWGYTSVNAMVKHWPGGGSGEAGRDAHYAFGKYAVYPGGNFKEHLKPFTEGAFKLKGGTEKAAAVMPYYTISTNQDLKNRENVGNGYSHYLVQELLRDEYGYDGVVCTDWGITKDHQEMDSFLSGKDWGVEELTVAERHYKVLLAGVDQFGGNNEVEPIMAAYELGKAEFGKEFIEARFRRSAKRLLRNLFQVGLFENPYIDSAKTKKTVGHPDFMKKGFEAQQKSIILLKNKNNVLPVAKKQTVYIPKRRLKASKDWFGQEILAREFLPVEAALVEKYYHLTTDPTQADFALCFMESPQTSGFSLEDLAKGGTGYVPISLQYRPYTARLGRKESLAGGDPLEAFSNRSYYGKSNEAINEADLDIVIETREKMGNKPLIAIVAMKNPTILYEFETLVDGILVDFGVQTQALLSLLSGEVEPSGLLPFQIPDKMESVEKQLEDVPFDMTCHRDENHNSYDFAYGLNWTGVITDQRVEKYGLKS